MKKSFTFLGLDIGGDDTEFSVSETVTKTELEFSIQGLRCTLPYEEVQNLISALRNSYPYDGLECKAPEPEPEVKKIEFTNLTTFDGVRDDLLDLMEKKK